MKLNLMMKKKKQICFLIVLATYTAAANEDNEGLVQVVVVVPQIQNIGNLTI